MATVRVFAHMKSKPGHEAEMRKALLELVKGSRLESGVIFYELFETRESGEFLVNEEYADQAAFDAHLASAHFKAAGEAVGPILDGDLSIWQVNPVEPA